MGRNNPLPPDADDKRFQIFERAYRFEMRLDVGARRKTISSASRRQHDDLRVVKAPKLFQGSAESHGVRIGGTAAFNGRIVGAY